MTSCTSCNENGQPIVLSNSPPLRPAINCDPPTTTEHCLLPQFRVLYSQFCCADGGYAANIALYQAENHVGGILNSTLKTQALMFAAAHLLEVGEIADLEAMQRLNAAAQLQSVKSTPAGTDFWASTTHGQAYLAMVGANPRLGLLVI